MVYPLAKITLGPFYRMWLKRVEGIENIPMELPVIIAANHCSYYDDLLMHCIVIPKIDKKVHALVNSRFWRYPLVKTLLEWGECVPVDVRSAPKGNEEAIEKAVGYLRKGEVLLIFPEGRRSTDNRLGKAYNGVAKICLKAKVPVLPVGIVGSARVLPKGKAFPRFARCEVKIGRLRDFEEYYGKESEENFEIVTREVMRSIGELTHQRYVY